MIVTEYGRKIEPGDKIKCFDKITERTVIITVKEVLSCDDYGEQNPEHPDYDWGFYCEYIIEETGKYGYWKQQYDGGVLIPKEKE